MCVCVCVCVCACVCVCVCVCCVCVCVSVCLQFELFDLIYILCSDIFRINIVHLSWGTPPNDVA